MAGEVLVEPFAYPCSRFLVGHAVAPEELLLAGERRKPGDRPGDREALEEELGLALPEVVRAGGGGPVGLLGELPDGAGRDSAPQREDVALGVGVVVGVGVGRRDGPAVAPPAA